METEGKVNERIIRIRMRVEDWLGRQWYSSRNTLVPITCIIKQQRYSCEGTSLQTSVAVVKGQTDFYENNFISPRGLVTGTHMSSILLSKWQTILQTVRRNTVIPQQQSITTSGNITDIHLQHRFQTCFSEILAQIPCIILKIQKCKLRNHL